MEMCIAYRKRFSKTLILMQKAIKSSILLLILVGMQNQSFSQPHVVNIADHTPANALFNEYWSVSGGMPAAVNFENYFFDKNGTFIYSYGYSGGIYYVTSVQGTYKYDAVTGEIKLKKRTISSTKGYPTKKKIPSKIHLKESTDTMVTLVTDVPDDQQTIMTKLVGLTTDQYWYLGDNSSNNAIRFTHFGQCEIVQITDEKRKFVCNYHLVDDYLFLEIKSITTDPFGKKEVKLYNSNIKTYIKIQVAKDKVAVEAIDITKIIDGGRHWDFKSNAFHLKNNPPKNSQLPFNLYNRVKAAKN